MSITSSLKYLRFRMMFGQQVMDAAEQLWSAVMISGASKGIEVFIVWDKHDVTMRAVYVLQALHPEVRIAVRQSRSFVLTLAEKGSLNVSDTALGTMLAGGQFANLEEFSASVDRMLAGQESFVRSQGFDPAQMEREGQAALAKRNAPNVDIRAEDDDVGARLAAAKASGEAERAAEPASETEVTP